MSRLGRTTRSGRFLNAKYQSDLQKVSFLCHGFVDFFLRGHWADSWSTKAETTFDRYFSAENDSCCDPGRFQTPKRRRRIPDQHKSDWMTLLRDLSGILRSRLIWAILLDISARIRFETFKSIEKTPTEASWRSRDSDSADFAVRGLDSSSGAPQPTRRY